MADKKISQLTGATTPLVGTEILPIVQSGSTVKVAVSDLTAGRAVSMSTATVTSGGSVGGSFGVGTTNPQQKLEVNGSAAVTGDSTFAGATFTGLTTRYIAGGNSAYLQCVSVSAGSVTGGKEISLDASQVLFRTISGGSFTERAKIDAAGNFVISTAGNGIDFSANTHAAGMTSELLNDYEEGTWTPTLTTNGFSGGVTLSSALGTYTKIGRQVTLQCTLNLSNFGYPSALTEIGSIPYTPATRNAGAYMGAHPSSSMGGACGVTNGGAVIYIPPSVATGTSTVWAVTITYFV